MTNMQNIAWNAKAMEEINRLSKKIQDKMKFSIIESEDEFVYLAYNLEYELEEIKLKPRGKFCIADYEISIKQVYEKIQKKISEELTKIQNNMQEESKKIQKRYM